MRLELHPLDREREADFYALHSPACDAGWCQCVAWYLDSWEKFPERSAEENRALRAELFARGEHDGFLGYLEGAPVLWIQALPRDRLPRLAREFALEPDPGAWGITCILVHPRERRRGLARRALPLLLDLLGAAGAARVEAYPKCGDGLDALDLWNGPEAIYREAGFEARGNGMGRRVMVLDLG